VPPPKLAELLSRIRQLSEACKAGDSRSPESFRDLVSQLLNLTVMKNPQGAVRLFTSDAQPKRFVLGGRNGPVDPIPLNDRRYLRLAMTLELVDTPEGSRLKVFESSLQYQLDREGKKWIFRYDYLRHTAGQHPPAHFQIRAKLTEGSVIRGSQTLERIHFPTSRVPLEAIINLLATDFRVRCNESPEVWRPALAESERRFFQIAHIPLSVFPV